MKYNEFFRLTTLKILVLLITLIFVFFVDIHDILFQPCEWLRTCPDYIRVGVINTYPNFYRPAGCGYGVGYVCWDASFSISKLFFDMVYWVIINLIFFLIIYTKKNK